MSEDTLSREGDCQIASFDLSLPKIVCMSNIRDAMGNANGDRHLEMFAFAVYGLIMFPKALGYVSVKLADFLFQIEKRVNPAPAGGSFSLGPGILKEIGRDTNQFKGKRKVLDEVAELTNKICNLEMRLRGRDEEVRRQREHRYAYVKDKEEEIMRQL
ncbi:hypothetical protein Goari_018332 [Gossypium aridum]|uniref:Uncharacterized protein n=1 Tax=Gossypium aridum TaxID=34290 RepID=A0A7J8WPB4_GOSAI|nr:hypothetical protein [Gossypium aridum]